MSPDIEQLLAGQQPELTPEQQEAADYLHRRQREVMQEMLDQMRRFAPVLCDCTRRRDPADLTPPQQNCIIHGVVHIDPRDGSIW